ncbi:hypothetical protein [Flavobacterium sp. ov086]|uniref:hypothetical protein n=1 Tax=Flavobacterium sp. ov086 TaxID=1761785 RepID=UPI000B6ADC6A|nr:hypothetical protein [Flavobacterium sp. ov086]SNR79680.1 hypothetical protein SAMN04487979_1229 [Flavobacterium sp. ov086]
MNKIMFFALVLITQLNFGQNIFPTSGNTSIGAGATPISPLHIKSSNDAILALQTTDDRWLYTQYLNSVGTRKSWIGLGYDLSSFNITVENGTDKILLNGGNVGINSPSPLNTFEVKVPTSKGVSSSDGISIHDGAVYRLGINIGVNTESEYSYIQAIKGGIGQKNIIINPIGGSVGIGTITTGTHKLAVEGSIGAREVKVLATGWADFVFKKEYNLPTLQEVEKHTNEKGHLENIPSEEEVLKNGINLGEMNAKLLRKIEELTLYVIEQEKKNIIQSEEIEKSNKQIERLSFENKTLTSISERLYQIEQKIK